MDEDLARETLEWKYSKPYDFYNNEWSEDALKERLDGSYRVITDENDRLFGFLCTGETAQIPVGHKYSVYNDAFVDMGLGMKPDYVGKGFGYSFCTFIINYISERNRGVPIRLSVATFNKRAIHVYEKIGFVKKDKFATNVAAFITMVKEN